MPLLPKCGAFMDEPDWTTSGDLCRRVELAGARWLMLPLPVFKADPCRCGVPWLLRGWVDALIVEL